MAERENDLPDGAELANALGDLFKSGNINDLQSYTNPNQEHQTDNNLQTKINRRLEDFIESLFKAIPLMLNNRRAAANALRQNFEIWKKSTALHIVGNAPDRADLQKEAEAVKNLTLKDVSKFARERLKELTKEVVDAQPDSQKFRSAKAKLDNWTKMEEIITPAADPD